MNAAGAGDHEADGFEHFYLATSQHVFRSAMRVANGRHLAEDATQEAYLSMYLCWEKWRHRTIDENHRYMIGIVINKVIDRYREEKRIASIHGVQGFSAGPTGADTVLFEQATMRAVRRVISKQSPRRRAVAVLYFIEEYGYSEIAETLGMAPSTVRTHVEQLRKVLRPLIDPNTGEALEGEQS